MRRRVAQDRHMPRLSVEIDLEQVALFKLAAKTYGLKLSQWVRLMLTAAAKGQLCKAERRKGKA